MICVMDNCRVSLHKKWGKSNELDTLPILFCESIIYSINQKRRQNYVSGNAEKKAGFNSRKEY